MKTQHTPTPWKTFLRDSQVGEENGQGICAMWRVLPELTDEQNAEGRANAAFIVRACNSHDALVEALQADLRAVRKIIDAVAANFSGDGSDDYGPLEQIRKEAENREAEIIKALALAKGE